MASKHGSTAGIRVPWAYIRRAIAKDWHVPPWEVDEADPEEVRIELAIRRCEAEVQGR